MPLPFAVMGVSAAVSAAIAAISEFQKSGDPQALAAAKQARGESIMEAMQRGMSRQEAEAQVDQSIQDAIVRNDYEFDASNVVGAGIVGGALGGLGAMAMNTKLAAQAMGKIGLGRGAAAQAVPKAGARRLVQPPTPQAKSFDDLDELTAMAPSAERGLAQVPGRSYGSVNAADPLVGTRTAYGGLRNAEVMPPRGVVPSSQPVASVRTYDVVPEPYGGNLGYTPGQSPAMLGYNPSRLPPSALSAEEATLVRNLGIPDVPGPSSPFTTPGTGMPPMMIESMMAQQEAARRVAGSAAQREFYRRLMAVSGD